MEELRERERGGERKGERERERERMDRRRKERWKMKMGQGDPGYDDSIRATETKMRILRYGYVVDTIVVEWNSRGYRIETVS